MKSTNSNFSPGRVLVTGAAHGIGFAVAQHFLDLGAQVALHTRGSVIEGDIGESQGNAHLFSGDFTVEDDVRRVIDGSAAAMGGLDAVVANVGGLVKRVPISEMTIDHWQRVMDVNVTSTMLTMRHAIGHLKKSEAGAIVTLSSLASHNGGGPGAAAYAAAKAAVIGLTKAAAKEFAVHRVRVNAVAPGFIGGTRFHETFSSAQSQEGMIASTVLNRPGSAGEVAQLVGFLSSPAASFITGETVDINGGQWFR